MNVVAEASADPSSSCAHPIATTSSAPLNSTLNEQLSDLSDADADGDVEHDQLDDSEDDEDDEPSSVLGSDLLNPPRWVKYTTKHLYGTWPPVAWSGRWTRRRGTRPLI